MATLLILYLFANEFTIPTLLNVVLDTALHTLFRRNLEMPFALLAQLCEELPPKAGMRRLLVSAVTATTTEEDVAEWKGIVPREFWKEWVDLARKEGPRSFREQISEHFMNEMVDRFCDEFHDHRDDDGHAKDGHAEEDKAAYEDNFDSRNNDHAYAGDEDSSGDEMEGLEKEEPSEKTKLAWAMCTLKGAPVRANALEEDLEKHLRRQRC